MHLFVVLVAAATLFAILSYLKRLLYFKRWDHFPGRKAITRWERFWQTKKIIELRPPSLHETCVASLFLDMGTNLETSKWCISFNWLFPITIFCTHMQKASRVPDCPPGAVWPHLPPGLGRLPHSVALWIWWLRWGLQDGYSQWQTTPFHASNGEWRTCCWWFRTNCCWWPPLLLSLDLCQHYHILKLKVVSVCLSVSLSDWLYGRVTRKVFFIFGPIFAKASALGWSRDH